MAFKKAEKEQGRLRLAISSPAGFGKTYTALRIAQRLAQHYGSRVAVIDTEHGSAAKYAHKFDFDSSELRPPFEPERYVAAIREAETAGYKVLIIDSGSHEWNGVGGCLEMVDKAAEGRSGNKWSAWSQVTPRHNKFIEAILSSPLHIIATYRSKMETAQVEEGGQKKIKKMGMAAVARDDTDYEFDVVGEIDQAHVMHITKTRCEALTDKEFRLPGEDVADILIAWLSDGAPSAAETQAEQPAQPAAPPVERPIMDEMPDGTAPEIREWFQRRIKTVRISPKPTPEQHNERAKQVAMTLKAEGLSDKDRSDAYAYLTGEVSGKDMAIEQLAVLGKCVVAGLQRCAIAHREAASK